MKTTLIIIVTILSIQFFSINNIYAGYGTFFDTIIDVIQSEPKVIIEQPKEKIRAPFEFHKIPFGLTLEQTIKARNVYPLIINKKIVTNDYIKIHPDMNDEVYVDFIHQNDKLIAVKYEIDPFIIERNDWIYDELKKYFDNEYGIAQISSDEFIGFVWNDSSKRINLINDIETGFILIVFENNK